MPAPVEVRQLSDRPQNACLVRRFPRALPAVPTDHREQARWGATKVRAALTGLVEIVPQAHLGPRGQASEQVAPCGDLLPGRNGEVGDALLTGIAAILHRKSEERHPCHRPSWRVLSRWYSSARHLWHVTATRFSVAIPSISARWAASLSRGLHSTMPSSLRACRSRFRLLSLD